MTKVYYKYLPNFLSTKYSGHLAARPLTFLTFSLPSPSWLLKLPSLFHQAFNGAFSHDVTVAILLFQSNPLRVDFCPYPNDFFCSSCPREWKRSIGHLLVAPNLCFKARLSAKPVYEYKHHFYLKGFALSSFSASDRTLGPPPPPLTHTYFLPLRAFLSA